MTPSTASSSPAGPAARRAWRFVLLLGLVSLLADVTYEGARGVVGPYLQALGASAAAVGLAVGAGEFIGYALRLVAGYASDRTGRYWLFTGVGYGLNLLAVPLLALAGRWPWAVALLLLERFGKALRSPARDAMLSHAASRVGPGKAFGLHEALDQLGAVTGPLLVAAVVAATGGYRPALAVLAGPALLALLTLTVAWRLYPHPQRLEAPGPTTPRATSRGWPRGFWLYVLAAGMMAAGFLDFALVAYHWAQRTVVPPAWVPLLYALAMGVDALAALAFGRAYDRWGLRVLVVAAGVSALAVALALGWGVPGAVLGAALWGVGMGAQESVLRAGVARWAPAARRATAYGVFNAGYGLAWFVGSAAMGWLYQTSVTAVVVFAALMQALAAFLLWRAAAHQPPTTNF